MNMGYFPRVPMVSASLGSTGGHYRWTRGLLLWPSLFWPFPFTCSIRPYTPCSAPYAQSPLGKNLIFNLLVYNNAKSILGNASNYNTSFLNGIQSFDVNNIHLPEHSHICSQRNTSMFSKRPRDLETSGKFPLLLCACHFGKLMEDDRSGSKETELYLKG